MARQRILILCTGNSARSQIAEGWLRFLAPERFEVSSAGSEPSTVHPLAVQSMSERGIDISQQRSKHVEELAGREFDYVLTVCDRAAVACPSFPGPARRLHWSFLDPAAVGGSTALRVEAFGAVRDEIEVRLREWLGRSSGSQSGDDSR